VVGLGIKNLSIHLEGHLQDCPVSEDDAAMILATSGTSGLCKGAILEHKAIMQFIRFFDAAKVKLFTHPKPNFLMFKSTHYNGANMPLAIIACGCSAVISPNFDAESIYKTIENFQASF